jgi:hypothetical protein
VLQTKLWRNFKHIAEFMYHSFHNQHKGSSCFMDISKKVLFEHQPTKWNKNIRFFRREVDTRGDHGLPSAEELPLNVWVRLA